MHSKNINNNLHIIHKLFSPIAPMVLCLAIWNFPLTHDLSRQLDANCFLLLNKSLLLSSYWQNFWGWLNHPNESWINLIVMLVINFTGVIMLRDPAQRIKSLKLVFYYWFFFQLGLLVSHGIFSDLLNINRESASLIIAPFVKLSTALAMPIKDYSSSSFPAGHTFVAIYWAGFTALYAPKIIKYLAWGLVPLLVLPRLFSGAHWLSDIIFTISMAYIWLVWAKLSYQSNHLKKFISWLRKLKSSKA